MRPWFQRASQATMGGPPAQNPASGKGSWEGTLWGHPPSFEGLPGSLNLSTGLYTCAVSLRSQHLYLHLTKGQMPLRRGPGTCRDLAVSRGQSWPRTARPLGQLCVVSDPPRLPSAPAWPCWLEDRRSRPAGCVALVGSVEAQPQGLT